MRLSTTTWDWCLRAYLQYQLSFVDNPLRLPDTAQAYLEESSMSTSLRLGVLTPSSNTALEPLTSAIVQTLPDASVHFSRFKVTEIALARTALEQFDEEKILAAAELLADARVDVIGWSG